LSIYSAYNINNVASNIYKNASQNNTSSKNLNARNELSSKSSNIEVVKSGQTVLASSIHNNTKSEPRSPIQSLRKKIDSNIHDKDHINHQNIKKAIFGNQNQELVKSIESSLSIENFSSKVKNVNVYVNEMVANIKEIMDEKNIQHNIKSSSEQTHRRFSVVV